MKNLIKKANDIGIFFSLLFLLCFFWYWLHPVRQELHMQLLQLSFFLFTDMNLSSFLSALIQSYIWGYILAGLWNLANWQKLRKGSNEGK